MKAVVFPEHNPVISPRGKTVHAVSFERPTHTACGKRMRRWRVALRLLNCVDCQLALRFDARPKKPKAKKRKRK